MRKAWLVFAIAALGAACSSDQDDSQPASTASQGLAVADRAEAGPAASLQRWAIEGKAARTTVMGLGANATVRGDGRLELAPVPVIEPSGRDVTPTWRYTTRLETLGRRGNAQPVGPVKELARTAHERIELDHGGATVRYTHRGVGLKQDVEVRTRPQGAGELELGFSVGGGVTLRTEEEAIIVTHGAREVWRWNGLAVFDAQGKDLSARMFARGEQLVIAVDDTDAAYPITVDPLATTAAWTPDRTGSSSNTNFGFKVKWAGDLDGDGNDDIIVAQPLARVNFTNEGRVLVYLSPNGVPNAVADAAIVGGEENAFMGQAITAAGDVDQDGNDDIAVGASNGQDTVDNEGVVYMYRGTSAGGAIESMPAWTQGSGQGGASFGSSLDSGDFNCDGRTDLIVGAGLWDEGPDNLIGKAYIYYADGTANYYGATPWERVGPAPGSRFGSLVAAAGNVNGDSDAGFPCVDALVAAANYQPSAGLASAGRVEIYAGAAAGVSTTPLFTVDGAQSNLFLGSAAAALGDTNGDGFDDVALGAQRWDDVAGADQGAIFVHLGDATSGLVATPQQTLLGRRADDRLGFAVAGGDFNGDGFGDLAGAAPLEDVNVNANEGRVTAWIGENGTGIAASSAWTQTGAQDDGRFGFYVHGDGDVDGDGFDDLLVGAPLMDANMVVNAGLVYLYRGGQTCLINGTVYATGDANPANPCEVCDAASPTAWTSLADGTSCSDPTVCGMSQTCQAGVCTGGGQTCDDGDPCTIDTCDSNGQCVFTTAPDGTVCGTDPNPCTELTCSNGSCLTLTNANGCAIDGTCWASGATNPANPCEVCDPATDAADWSPAAVGTACNDGLFCTVGETCDASGACTGGAARDCSGAIDQCNNDPFCNEGAKRCQGRPTNEGGMCDDSDLCTTNDVCESGVCVGAPVDCSNLDDECNQGLCQPDGSCGALPRPDGTSCGTTAGEACFDGQCIEPIPTAEITGASFVDCEDSVELDGTSSTDDRSLPLTYDWSQVSPMSPNFIGGAATTGEFLELTNSAPCPTEDTVVTFGLVVNNGFNDSQQATFEVTFRAAEVVVGDEPMSDAGMTADAGTDAGQDAGAMVDMGTSDDAGATTDAGGDAAPSVDGELSGSGCGCASGQSAPTDAAPLLLLLVGMLIRRRRR